jgi:flagellar biosynthesis/type III secretory pathway protein FliH
MSLFLVPIGQNSAVGSSTPLIKARDKHLFENAIDLFTAAEQQKSESQAAFDAARQAGFEQGLSEGRDAVEQSFREQAAEMARQVAVHAEERQRDIADAALAATKAILGSVDPQIAVPGIIDQVLGRLENGSQVTVLVHPLHADALNARLQNRSDVVLTTDPAFGLTDCEILTADGRIVASMSVQIEALAQRWGVAPEDEE